MVIGNFVFPSEKNEMA